MKIWNRITYLKDLKTLDEIIKDFNISGDFKGISNIIEVIEKNEKDIVDYNLSDFSLHLKGAIAGTTPKNLHYCKIDLENRLALKDELSEEIDPLFKYTLDLKISLYKSEKDQTKHYCNTWHLDKEDRDLNFSYHHPYYHFQFGGKKHEFLDPDMAILGSPRIPHPPMDIILAFHFILNNFVDRKKFNYVDEITSDYRYNKIIQNSTNRLWKPYFNTFTETSPHKDYKVNRLFPLYENQNE